MKLNPCRVVFDTTYQDIDDRLFKYQYKVIDQWRDFQMEAINPLPHIIPEPLRKTIQIFFLR